jgi:enoyl-CoA hydratase/carnithine racemase
MELTTTAVVRLPETLDGASVRRLALDIEAALASSEQSLTLAGATDDDFCLGLGNREATDGPKDVHAFGEVLLALHHAPKPLLALVDGRAIGGGLGLAAACDWVIATDRSTFALPELLWGLVPAIIWPVVTDRMAAHVARQWALSATARPAADAAAAGLVDEVVSREALGEAAARAGHRLARLDGDALRAFREWVRTSQGAALADIVSRGVRITRELIDTPRVRRRRAAFEDGEAPWE